jgi:hypothetical protein
MRFRPAREYPGRVNAELQTAFAKTIRARKIFH